MTIQLIEWEGKEYEVKYSFKFVQRLKAAGVSLPRIYGEIRNDPNGSGYFLDEFVIVAAECLKEAGAPVTVEQVWQGALTNKEFAAACGSLFMWLVTQHYATSPNAPKPKN